jgi:hypothetical protein
LLAVSGATFYVVEKWFFWAKTRLGELMDVKSHYPFEHHNYRYVLSELLEFRDVMLGVMRSNSHAGVFMFFATLHEEVTCCSRYSSPSATHKWDHFDISDPSLFKKEFYIYPPALAAIDSSN